MIVKELKRTKNWTTAAGLCSCNVRIFQGKKREETLKIWEGDYAKEKGKVWLHQCLGVLSESYVRSGLFLGFEGREKGM